MYSPGGYRRDAFTWAAFAALAGFGFLNSALGPAMPFISEYEHISYVVASLHQVAFALGGGIATMLAATGHGLGRAVTIRGGLLAAGMFAVLLGYGKAAPVTIAAALLVSFFGTSALVRLWAALADVHGEWRSVALAEGEVAISFSGIATPLLIGAIATSLLGWRFSFVIIAVLVIVSVAISAWVTIPGPRVPERATGPDRSRWGQPTLLIIFAITGAEFGLSFWLASYLHDVVGLHTGLAATMVSGLYLASLIGQLGASLLARAMPPDRLLTAALAISLAGLPFLLAGNAIGWALLGILVTGAGIGALFPVASSLHVARSLRAADQAIGQVLVITAIGQIVGPLMVAVIAQAANLHTGMLTLPALILLAAVAMAPHRRWPRVRQGSSSR